ncbi:MAG: enoyl-CoA hydratase [Actinomycetota bacterium]|nr:enoyl-CoA hydratase [Actinomycetota bacterium]
MPDERVIRTEIGGGTAVVTLERPAVRNALNGELLAALGDALTAADAHPEVASIILTGADPAFCAGLDLKELSRSDGPLTRVAAGNPGGNQGSPWPPVAKPVIGAINGVAITGGLELALHCDFLVASERARFADTHTRVGILPGWGLTVRLPEAIGLRRAKEMSATGNFLDAVDALRLGLVNHVVAHADLLPFCRRLASDIASNDPEAVVALLASYRETSLTTGAEGLQIEHRIGKAWRARTFDPVEIERRRTAVIARGRSQI